MGRSTQPTAASGNSRAERSLRARMQRRDRYGRFAEMGGGFSFNFKFASGSSGPAAGRVVGQSGEDLIEVEMRGVEGVPDGIYSAPSQKGTAVKAVLKIDGSNVRTENIKKTITEEDAIDFSTLKVSAQPSGWTPKDTADGEPKEWLSEDGLAVRQFADTYVAYETDDAGNVTNEIARGESWADIQKSTENYEKIDKSQSPPEDSSLAEPENAQQPPTDATVEVINNIGETGPSIDTDLPDQTTIVRDESAQPSSEPTKSPEKNLKPGDLSADTTKVKSSGDSLSMGSSRRDEVTIYNVGEKRVAFGVPDSQTWEQDISDVEILPLNPFTISGLDEKSEEGQKASIDWNLAIIGTGEETGQVSATEASSLLYAASRGDTDAENKFNELVEKGRRAVEQQRLADDQMRQSIIDREAELRKSFVDKVKSTPGITDEQIEELIKPSQLNGFSGLSIDDLFLVHETTYDTEYDEDGNVILRPNEDYPMLDENGQPLLDAEGRPYDLYRGSLHFSINHRVSGHEMRETPEESTVIMIPLRSVLEANPGSLDNLYGVDTYLTPPPGQPLRLPAGAVRTVKLEKDAENPWKTVHEELQKMGMDPGVAMYGGADSVGAEADERIRGIASQLGTQNMMHAHSSNATFERMRRHEGHKYSMTAPVFTRLGRNALMRLAHKDRWSGLDTVTGPESVSVA